MIERIRTPLVLFVLTAMALAGATLLMIPATFPDISIHRVSFTNTYSGEGETIEALLVTPDVPPEGPMPAVVFAHGILMNKETYLSLWRDLARRGIAVLAVDLPGHGGSGGGSDLGRTEYTAMLAGYDWLVSEHPEIDPGKVAAIGHSLGGISATRAGILQPEKKFSTVAAIYCWPSERLAMEDVFGRVDDFVGNLWPLLIYSRDFDVGDPGSAAERDNISLMGPGTPPNYLLITGRWDELVTIEHEEEIVAAVAGREEIEPGEIYGSFEEGTACKLAITDDDHLSEIFSPWVFEELYNWLCKSFGIRHTGSQPLPVFRFGLWAIMAICVILMAFLLTVILARLLQEREAYPLVLEYKAGAATKVAAAGKLGMAGISIVYFALAALISLPLAIWLGLTVLTPFLGGDFVSSMSLVRGLFTGAGLAAGAFLFYKKQDQFPELPWKAEARSMLTSAFPPLAGFGLLLILYTPLAHIFYLGQALPWNWGWFALEAALFTGLLWTEGRYFHLFLLPIFGDVTGWKRKLAYLAGEAVIRAGAAVLMVLPFVIAHPWHIVGRAGFIRFPVLLAVGAAAFPAYLVVAWLNLGCRSRRISLLLPSLGLALLQAWLLTALMCAR